MKDVSCSICGTVRPLDRNAREEGFACSQLCRLIRNGELPADAADRLPWKPCAVCGKEVQMNRNFTQPRFCGEKCSKKAKYNRMRGRAEDAPSRPANQKTRLRKSVAIWIPPYGLATCTWCGDWYGKAQPAQKTCGSKCSKELRRHGPIPAAKHRTEYRKCAVCGDEFQTTMKRRKYCDKAICKGRGRPWTPDGWKSGAASTNRYFALRRAAVEKGDRTLTTLTMYQKANGVCATCGIKTMHPQTPRAQRPRERYNWATLDHIKPLSQGGSHTWDNAQLLCLSCNSRKSHQDRKALASTSL